MGYDVSQYDSTEEEHGSLGTIDNGSGAAAILSLAKHLKGKRLIAFRAEEIDLLEAYILAPALNYLSRGNAFL